MRPIVIDLLRGMISGAIIAAGIGIGLAAGSALAQEAGTIPGRDGFYPGPLAGTAFSEVGVCG